MNLSCALRGADRAPRAHRATRSASRHGERTAGRPLLVRGGRVPRVAAAPRRCMQINNGDVPRESRRRQARSTRAPRRGSPPSDAMGIEIAIACAKAVFMLLIALQVMAMGVFFERKVSAVIQDRIGANRAAIFGFAGSGLINTLVADPVKFLLKEDVRPAGADRLLHLLAPVMAVMPGDRGVRRDPVRRRPRDRRAARSSCRRRSSTSASSTSSRWRRSASTASCWPAGRRTTAGRCSAASAARRR